MKNTLNIGGKILNLQKPVIMGIINITPDSFHKDSRFNPFEEEFLKKAHEMLENGAIIIDIGGYSSRPGAKIISENEEIDRIQPAIETLKKHLPESIISIDTFRKNVAENAIKQGASIINDISAGELDQQMFPYIIKTKTPYIMMHMRGNPQTMERLNSYNDFYFDILLETYSKANYLRKNGATDIIIDPGFGFSKDISQNYQILKNLQVFKNANFPILIGLSRKSMIYKYLEIDIENSLEPTSQLQLQALLNGASILRVHDPISAKKTIKLYEILKNQ